MITSGGTVVFEGTVTNDSGANLAASDFFFNFFGFNRAVTPTQLLGTPDFALPNGSTSAAVDLFSVTVGAAPNGAKFTIEVSLEDVNSDLSSSQTVSVTVSGTAVVPEPAS